MSHISRIATFSRLSRQIGNGAEPLTDDQLRQLAPSVFQTEPHHSRSERFAYIPTHQVLAALRRSDFLPVRAVQGRSRSADKVEYTKHMVRFRHRSSLTPTARQDRRVGQVFPEIVLVNAHDGTSAYKIFGGLFRLVCLNGMVVRDTDAGEVTVHHKGNVVDQVIEGSYQVLDTSVRAMSSAGSWAATQLSRAEQVAFAEAAHTIRFADHEGHVTTPIQPDALLLPRRNEDRSDDLWTTFNRVQENAIRGGLTAYARDAEGRRRATTSRPIQAIDADVKVNRALWQLGQRMAELKGAA